MSFPRIAPTIAVFSVGLSAVVQAQTFPSEYPPQEQYAFRAEYREFRPELNGEAQKSSGGLEGTLLDLQRDLGLGVENERTFEVRATIQFKRGHKIRGSYTPLDYEGDLPARAEFNYGNTTFQRLDRIVTSLKGGYYSGSYEWDLFKGPRGYLGALVGVKVFDLDAVVLAPDQGLRETDTLRAPVPVLGAVGRVYAGRVSLEGEFSGLSIGSKGSLYEFETSARVHLSDRLAIQGGYRRLSVNAQDGDDEGNIKLGGWQFGLEISL
jgi:hypothetical protein